MPQARAGRAAGAGRSWIVLTAVLVMAVGGTPWIAPWVPAVSASTLLHAQSESRSREVASCPDGPRIVSLSPAITAALRTLGAEGCVVGRASDDPSAVGLSARTVGTVLSPNPEALRATDPELVFVWGPESAAVLQNVERTTGARIVALPAARLADVAPTIRRVGDLVDRQGVAARLADRLSVELNRVSMGSSERSLGDVIWAVGRDPGIVAGPGSLPDDLLSLIGAHNVAADAGSPWPLLSPEVLLTRDADVLIWPVGGDLPPFAELGPHELWARYVRRSGARVVELDADLMHQAGPRVAEAARVLAARLK